MDALINLNCILKGNQNQTATQVTKYNTTKYLKYRIVQLRFMGVHTTGYVIMMVRRSFQEFLWSPVGHLHRVIDGAKSILIHVVSCAISKTVLLTYCYSHCIVNKVAIDSQPECTHSSRLYNSSNKIIS